MSAALKTQMCARSTTPNRDMTRAETAQYITDHWFPRSVKTLAKLAVTGGGPPFRKAGRVPLYSKTTTDAWAQRKIGPLVYSTTEQTVGLRAILGKAERAPTPEDAQRESGVGKSRGRAGTGQVFPRASARACAR